MNDKKIRYKKFWVPINFSCQKFLSPTNFGYKNFGYNDLVLNIRNQKKFWNLPLKFGQN